MTDRVPCGRSVTGVYYGAFMQKLRRKMHNNQPLLLVAEPLILHDNARPYIADVVTKKLRDYGWEVLPHAPCSPEMSPIDFDIPKIKRTYVWTMFFFFGGAYYQRYPSYSTHE